jgi:nucleoid-associated protein EbfC
MFNVGEMMGQLQKTQAQMQEQIKKQAELLARTEVIGQSGGGLVKVYVNGQYAARRVEVDRKLLKDDPEMAEDLIAAAFNDAANKINELKESQMKSMTGGLDLSSMGLPAGFKLPF